ncbi:hypothetical protein [Brevibacillus sp. SYSU BS000544]
MKHKVMNAIGALAAVISSMHAVGILCTLHIYEPTPPHLREE